MCRLVGYHATPPAVKNPRKITLFDPLFLKFGLALAGAFIKHRSVALQNNFLLFFNTNTLQ
jgi:hypothetical protein